MRDSCRIAAVAFPMLKKREVWCTEGHVAAAAVCRQCVANAARDKVEQRAIACIQIALFFYLETSLQSAGCPVGCPESETQPLECIKMSL